MYGAILGDIAGSKYEFSRPEKFDPWKVKIFSNDCCFTDDTVMTIATKYAVLKGVPYAKAYGVFGRKYPNVGYGTMFKRWIDSYCERGYNSYGNGSAMRVSFIGEHFDTLKKVEGEAQKSALCTHNHPEGVKGAQVIAGCGYLAKNGASKKEIKSYVQKKFGYSLNKRLSFYRVFSRFDMSCQKSVPLALQCFLESDSWEECIRNVFSVRCDTDTIGAIAGGIADAYFHGTGFDEDALLRQFLIKPNKFGAMDPFLYQWAIAKQEESGEPS